MTIPVVCIERKTLHKFHKWLPHDLQLVHALIPVIGPNVMTGALLAGYFLLLNPSLEDVHDVRFNRTYYVSPFKNLGVVEDLLHILHEF